MCVYFSTFRFFQLLQNQYKGYHIGGHQSVTEVLSVSCGLLVTLTGSVNPGL